MNPRTMKAISLWQPWASLWLTDRKIHETRTWTPPESIGRHVLVHASKTPKGIQEAERIPELRAILEDEFGGHWARELPLGGLIGVVTLISCKPTERVYSADYGEGLEAKDDNFHCGNFTPGRWAWERGQCYAFPQRLGFAGRQGFFDVPWDDVKLLCPAWVTP